MASKRVLLAAEFLRGGATLTRLLPLAAALVARGHDVALAVPVEVAPTGFALFAAPRWRVPPPPGYVAVCYADLLMHGGYAAPDALRDLMAGWRLVLEQARPDLLVVDFAPTAMLAARVAGVAMACVGDGFSLPPLRVPLPDMRPWAGVAADEIESVEGRVLAVINARINAQAGAARTRGLGHLRELFADVPVFLCAFAELDHYGGRIDGAYYGAVFPPSSGPEAVWPAGEGQRVYVDLDPRHPALPWIVDAVDRLGLPCLVQGGGMAARQAEGLARRLVQVSGTANRAGLMAGSDFVVCQGVDVVAPALLAGKPVLMLPVFVEQMMTLHRVATQGLGHGIDPASDGAAIEAAVRRLAADTACQRRAVNFGRSYDGYGVATAIEAVADEIGSLLAG